MKQTLCLAAAIWLPGLALSQKPEVMDTVGFLTKDVPELELNRVTLAQAVEHVRKAVSTDTLQAPEVRFVRYESPHNSDDFPFREDGDFLISTSLSDVTVHQTLELLCFAAGFTLDLTYGEIRCFQVPHRGPISNAYLGKPAPMSPAKVVLPKFKVDKMSLHDAMKLLRSHASKACSQRFLPLVHGEYKWWKDDSKYTKKSELVSLDLSNVPFEECLRYVSELSGCNYRISSEGHVCIQALHTLYHPKYCRVASIADFARVLKTKPAELTEDDLADWMSQKLDIFPPLTIHRTSGLVYFEWLRPHEVSALQRALSWK
jgi:hypothetical protein